MTCKPNLAHSTCGRSPVHLPHKTKLGERTKNPASLCDQSLWVGGGVGNLMCDLK